MTSINNHGNFYPNLNNKLRNVKLAKPEDPPVKEKPVPNDTTTTSGGWDPFSMGEGTRYAVFAIDAAKATYDD